MIRLEAGGSSCLSPEPGIGQKKKETTSSLSVSFPVSFSRLKVQLLLCLSRLDSTCAKGSKE